MANTYKYYMVMEIIENGSFDDWCVGEFRSKEEAVRFADAYTPCPREDGEVIRIEIWGTDEEPDTFKFCDEVYKRTL